VRGLIPTIWNYLTLVNYNQSNKELRYLLPLKEEYLLFVRSLAFFADGE